MASLYVSDQFPAPDATGVFINDVVYAQFTEPVATGSVTYYNFTVGERETYEPVPGSISYQGISGGIDDAIAIFVPDNGLKRNTAYTVFLSTAITSKTGNTLDHDEIWYFTTGNDAASGTIGDDQFELDPSGFTTSPSGDTSGPASGVGVLPLEVVETTPVDYATNQPRNLPYISVTFSAPLPTGSIDMYRHIQLTSRSVK